ncbi:hypothetical protein [Terrabacter terrigena]|uniref:Ig-like domain-containing protein n=1 Tax=Terrabacter terrigena TaxID=574718 RepID=A0ABW3N0P1_9MICO
MADQTTLYSGNPITASGSSTPVAVPLGSTVAVTINATTVSGTTPSATFEVQWSHDGVNWASADGTADSFAAITAAKSVARSFTVKGTLLRLVWTVSGTTPSFTTTAYLSGVRVLST